MPREPGTCATWQLVAPLSSGGHGGSPERVPGGQTGDRHSFQRYLFRIRGQVGTHLARRFAEMEVESEGVDTLLIGSLPDSAALYGVVAQLERMDLELFEISRLPGDSGHGRQTEDGPNDLERR